MHVEDKSLLSGEPFDMGLFPHIWGNPAYEEQYGLSGHRINDLSGTTKVCDSVAKITVSYERAIDMSPKGDPLPHCGHRLQHPGRHYTSIHEMTDMVTISSGRTDDLEATRLLLASGIKRWRCDRMLASALCAIWQATSHGRRPLN